MMLYKAESAANYVPSAAGKGRKPSILSMCKINFCIGRDEETSGRKVVFLQWASKTSMVKELAL